MKFILTAVLALVAASAQAEPVTHIRAYDNHFTPVPQCGRNARVKAVFSRASYQLALRVCGNDFCEYPVKINTNRDFQIKGDTSVYPSEHSGIALGGGCYEFPLRARLQPNQKHIRAVLGSDTLIQNRARIEIDLYN